MTTPTQSPCSNWVNFIDSLFSWTGYKPNYEKPWIHWPIQQKDSHLRRKRWAKTPPCWKVPAASITHNHFFLMVLPHHWLSTIPFGDTNLFKFQTLGKPILGQISPRIFEACANTFLHINIFFLESLATITRPTDTVTIFELGQLHRVTLFLNEM